jgi:hypothetical protein
LGTKSVEAAAGIAVAPLMVPFFDFLCLVAPAFLGFQSDVPLAVRLDSDLRA